MSESPAVWGNGFFPPPEQCVNYLVECGNLLGNPVASQKLSISELTERESGVSRSLSLIFSRKRILLHKPAAEAEAEEPIEIISYHTPMSQEPYVKDRAGTAMRVSELCHFIAQGAEITLIDLPNNP